MDHRRENDARGMRASDLEALVARCRDLIEERYPTGAGGAAAMLTSAGTILLGTAPQALNPAVELCHEVEPFCAAHRLGEAIAASVCLHREPGSAFTVLAPCGVCQERLATHGPTVLVAVRQQGGSEPAWVPLREFMPHYWLEAFEDAPAVWRQCRGSTSRGADPSCPRETWPGKRAG